MQVKMVIIKDGCAGPEFVEKIPDILDDWENIDDETYQYMLQNSWALREAYIERKLMSYSDKLCILTKNIETVPEAITSIKQVLDKRKAQDAEYKRKNDEATAKRKATAEANKAKKELELLKKLKEKFPEEV